MTQKPSDPASKAKTAEEEKKRRQIAELQARIRLREGLPFLYGWKWYKWAREFYESTNKINLLCAANQISKSSTQIRKCINWATDQKLWSALWIRKPTQFWYLYPSTSQATIEFNTKWQQFLPQGEYKTHPVYGWKAEFKHSDIFAIHFNSGVHVYFKTYTQNVQHLQTGSVDALWADEEVPVEIYEELMFRISASDGYFHMVFTATMGQEYWRQVMEPLDSEEERLPGASKWIVSMYDCMTYEDGEESHWTLEKIKTVEDRCTSHNEILRRVHGRFIKDEGGKKYAQFDLKRHLKTPHPVPKDWITYAAVDIGGGGDGHPAAIVFLAVRPDLKAGRVFLGWRGDGVLTTAGDVLDKFIELRDKHKLKCTAQFYDWASKDFATIAGRRGEPFQPADKNHERGEQILNTLFKNDMLYIYETEDLTKLGAELAVLRKDQPKRKAKDDFADALRYAVTGVAWDFSDPAPEAKEKQEAATVKLSPIQQQIADRRKVFDEEEGKDVFGIQEELEEWSELYDY